MERGKRSDGAQNKRESRLTRFYIPPCPGLRACADDTQHLLLTYQHLGHARSQLIQGLRGRCASHAARALVPRMQLFGRAFTWTPAHADKLIHVVLGFSLLSMSSRLLTQKNRMEEEKAELQKRLDHDLEDSVRRRQRLLLRAPELAKSAGLSASASAQFGAALSALDAEPLPAVAAAGTEVVPRPPPLDPRAALPEGGEKKAVAIF